VLLGAFFWAGHVQFIARFSPRVDPIRLSFVQAMFTSLISFGIGFFLEEFQLQQILSVAVPILYGGVISIGLTYTLQVIAQQDAKPTYVAIFLSLESVFAVFWGWLLIKEVLTPPPGDIWQFPDVRGNDDFSDFGKKGYLIYKQTQ